MKMSDVFVSKIDAGDVSVFTGRVRDCCNDSVIPHEAVAHAINNHDALVEALEAALEIADDHPGMPDLSGLHKTLEEAKS